MKPAVTICGSYRGVSGHDHHVREFVQELHQQGIQIRLRDLPSWSPYKLKKSQQDSWFDSLQSKEKSHLALHFCMPHQVKRFWRKKNINFTMFEATHIPSSWVKRNLKHDLVIVPTDFSRQTWIRSGYPEERIRLCPLGTNSQVFTPEAAPLSLADVRGKPFDTYRLRILNVSDVIPRKNLTGLLEVWLRATHKSDDAVLLLKLNCSSTELWQNFLLQFAAAENSANKRRAEAAPVVMLHNQFYLDAEMPGLYTAATHYWSMSHGEGWDQPMMEAAAAGLQLIAPEHSAYNTYLDDEIARMIPVRQIPASFTLSNGSHKFFRGAEWWLPDQEAATEYIRQILMTDHSNPPQSARKRISEHFTWKQATSRLIQILEESEGK